MPGRKRDRKKFVIGRMYHATVLLIFSSVLIACGVPIGRRTRVDAPPITIGAIFDLTGPTSEVGVPYANGVKAYVNYINSTGGIADRPVELISGDSAYRVENSERLFSQYVNQGNVVALIGWGTADINALTDRITVSQLPFMSASLAEELADAEQAPYTFVVGVTYSDQTRIALQYLLAQHGTPGLKLAYLYNDSSFGLSPMSALNEIAERYAIEVLAVPMPRGAISFEEQVRQLEAFEPDYVLVQNTPSPAATALLETRAAGLDTPFVMLNYAANEILIERAETAAEGVIGVLPFAPVNAEAAAFDSINQYLKRNNLGTLADADKGLTFSQGWTTMSVLIAGVRRAAEADDLSGASIKTHLESLQQYETGGVTVPLSYSATNHKGATALRLYQVQNGQWIRMTDLIDANLIQ